MTHMTHMDHSHHPHCPACGQPLPREDAIDARVQALRQYCEEHEYTIFPGDRVREDAAAKLVGLEPGTLRNWFYRQDTRLPGERDRARRRMYRLEDVAKYLAGSHQP